MKRFAILLLSAALVNFYWIDGRGDASKTVLVMEYDDGTTDKLVVNLKDLKNEQQIVDIANKMLQKKGLTDGN